MLLFFLCFFKLSFLSTLISLRVGTGDLVDELYQASSRPSRHKSLLEVWHEDAVREEPRTGDVHV